MSAAARPDERRVERRRRERRAGEADRRLPAGESWFGALDDGDAPAYDTEAASVAGDARAQADAWAEAERASSRDSRYLGRHARRLVGSVTSFERLYRSFVGARAVVGVLVLLLQIASGLAGVHIAPALLTIAVAYAGQAIALWLLPRIGEAGAQPITRLTHRQWLATVGVDLLAFSALHLLERSAALNYDALLLLPVLMGAVLASRRRALATAAVATLFLLGVALIGVAEGGEPVSLLTPAGLAGGGLFLVTLLAGELAGRLAREELAARGSLELARQQAQLNRLVIEEMSDGVLVVDRRGRVRAANPAARRLLVSDGMARAAPFPLRGVDAWQPLVAAVERAFTDGQWPEAGRDVALELGPGLPRTLRLRVRFTRRRDASASEDVCVLFVEDVLTLQARLRQEKLAAMGRVSAGIAHEIRNPLAAIAQANALLAEDATDPAQQRLAAMVADNVERLKRIVDDVLEVAPGTAPEVRGIDAAALVERLAGEWAATAGLESGAGSPLRVALPAGPLPALFDAEHLRRVLVNLLDNALRHCSRAPGAIRLELSGDDPRLARLSVASDGAAIAPEVERYLFEPFFSTRSRGTGLGLYICRELCERYGARIDYRQRPAGAPHRNEFVVAMRRVVQAAEGRSLHPVT